LLTGPSASRSWPPARCRWNIIGCLQGRRADSGWLSGSATATLSIQNVQANDVGGYSVREQRVSPVPGHSTTTTRYVNVNNPTRPRPTPVGRRRRSLQDAIDAAGAATNSRDERDLRHGGRPLMACCPAGPPSIDP
jgi:hypothetical protein